MNLQEVALALAKKHGSQNAAARAVQITGPYLNQMIHGHVQRPSDHILRRMGVRFIPAMYEFTKTKQ